MAKRPEPVPERITRDDLEERFRLLQDGVRHQVEDRRSTFMMAAGIGGLAIVLLIFLLGRRSGTKKTTYIEIRRV